MEEVNPQPHPTPQIELMLWSRIWKLKTAPKIQHFIWKSIKGALAVRSRLQSRGILSDVTCPSCHCGPETVCHTLFNCPMALQAWTAAELPSPRSGFSQSSTVINIHHMLACIGKKSIEPHIHRAFPWTLWNIWKARNSFVFQNSRISAEGLAKKARDECEKWGIANGFQEYLSGSFSLHSLAISTWKSPPKGYTKCNIGASWLNPQNQCGAAWILRDHRGTSLFHSRRAYSNIQTGIEAELLSLLWAVENLGHLKQRKVIFELSSTIVLEVIQFRNKSRGYAQLISSIHHMLHNFEAWKVVPTQQTCNRPALLIARSVTEQGRHHSYISRGAPPWLSPLILAEMPARDI